MLERLQTDGLLRFKLYVGAALVVLALGNGFALMQIREANRADCRERTERAAATAPVLAELVEAHSKDGNPHASAVWRHYLEEAQKNPLPKC